MKINERNITSYLKQAQNSYEKMDSYCAKMTRAIEPFLPVQDEDSPDYEDFGVQWMTDGFCCYFDTTVVPVKKLVALLNEQEDIQFHDIKRIAI